MFIAILSTKAIAGYITKINLNVTATFAKPIFCLESDEKIIGSYSKIAQIPEYIFEIKNSNDEFVSEIDFNLKIKVECSEKIEYEIIMLNTNEKILDNNNNYYEIFLEKNKDFLGQYKLCIKTAPEVTKGKIKIYIDAKYYKYELEAFDINIDQRKLQCEIYTNVSESKYTNKDVNVLIKCNKEIKHINGFELSEDKTTLNRNYSENINENIVIEDYYGNTENVEIIINNIDKELPEIVGIADGGVYSKGLKLIYKDNIGIKSINIENTSLKKSYKVDFKEESKIIDNEVLVVNSNSISPYYLNQVGDYKIVVTDFAGNVTVKSISIK